MSERTNEFQRLVVDIQINKKISNNSPLQLDFAAINETTLMQLDFARSPTAWGGGELSQPCPLVILVGH